MSGAALIPWTGPRIAERPLRADEHDGGRERDDATADLIIGDVDDLVRLREELVREP